MIRSAHLAAGVTLALTVGACASGGSTPTTNAPDRIIMTSPDPGFAVLRSTTDAAAKSQFSAAPEQVWTAVQGVYADLAIAANRADKAQWHYAALNYAVPRRIQGVGVAALFSCGSSMTGPLAEQGRVTADVVTKLFPNADGSTSATIYVDGVLRKNEGASGDPIHCSSTGRLEELLRKSIDAKLSGN